MDKSLEIIIKSKAMELGIDVDVAKVIVDDLFSQVRENMKNSDINNPDSYKNMRIIGLGLLYSKEDKRKRMLQKFNKQHNK